MKKRFFAIFAALFTMLCLVPLGAYALDFDPRCVELSFDGAPKVTYYVDILIKMDSSDEHYTDFNAPSQCYVRRDDSTGTSQFFYTDLSGITSDSEIAKYNKDGYVSLLCHYSGASMKIWSSEYSIDGIYKDTDPQLSIPYETETRFTDLFNQYGAFKAAYVDKDGNVLGVTKKAKRSYDTHEPYAFIADGDRLTFRIFSISPKEAAILYAVVYGVPLLVIVLIIIKLRNAVWKRRTISNIREEAENGEE